MTNEQKEELLKRLTCKDTVISTLLDINARLSKALNESKEMGDFVRGEFSRHEYETQGTSECDFPCMRDGTMASFRESIKEALAFEQEKLSEIFK